MTENEAVKHAREYIKYLNHSGWEKDFDAIEKLIVATEEIQQYRELGTVEELQSMKDNGAFSEMELTQIAAMLMKLKKYKSIGTIEEFKALKEKSEPKKPIRKPNHDWTHEVITCPTCNGYLSLNEHHCRCGQKIEME